MDKNTITGLLLLFAIIVGWGYMNQPTEEEIAKQKHKQDSIANINARNDSLKALQIANSLAESEKKEEIIELSPTGEIKDTTLNKQLVNKYGVFASSSLQTSKAKTFHFTNGKVELILSTIGGKILNVNLPEFHTYDSLALKLFDPKSTHFNLAFFLNNRLFNTEDFHFKPYLDGQLITDTLSQLGNNDSKTFSMRLYPDQVTNSYIEFAYTLKKDDYMLDFDIRFIDMDAYLDQRMTSLDLLWNTDLLLLEKSIDRFNGPTIYYKYFQDDVDYLKETKDDEEELTTSVKWISFKHRFFSSILMAKNNFSKATIKAYKKENPSHKKYVRTMNANISLTYNKEIPLQFYFGPNKYDILKSYNQEFERSIPLGWSFAPMSWINRYVVIPVFNLFEGFGWGYGIIILVLTILLKLALFPLTYKSYLSSAKMRVLKPDIDKIGEKYPKKEDAMKKQQATMALYKKAGANPMAGCLPMVLQMPILFAMFRFFPAAFELRQQSFLWAEDLSAYDSILNLPFDIPFVGAHLSGFTILMTISTILYTRANQSMMATNQSMPGMKTMMYLMPVMFFGIFNGYASALSYYYFLANMMTFSQMYIIKNYIIDEDKLRKKLDANKKKVKPKSKWQQRMDEAMKQKGYKK